MCFIKSDLDFVFGGFTMEPWTSDTFNWQKDPSAFLFSLSSHIKYEQIPNKHDKSAYHHKDYLVTFGGGHDLCIMNLCNLNKNSYCNVGNTYKPVVVKESLGPGGETRQEMKIASKVDLEERYIAGA